MSEAVRSKKREASGEPPSNGRWKQQPVMDWLLIVSDSTAFPANDLLRFTVGQNRSTSLYRVQLGHGRRRRFPEGALIHQAVVYGYSWCPHTLYERHTAAHESTAEQ
jgi:hypothetical protein